MTRILAIGECMVEMAPSGPDNTYRIGFAGDTMNTAWYLRRLLPEADQIAYLTAVGIDALSDQMVAFLDSAGIGTHDIIRRADLTVGLYMIQLQDGERSFSYWRGQSAARTLARSSIALTKALAGTDIVYFSGITMAILPPQDRLRLLAAFGQFRAGGGEVVFDPNLRPRLWSDPNGMTDTITSAAQVSTTILPSYEDEATWFGDTTPADTARRYAGCGAGTVVVKNGPDEILIWNAGATSSVSPKAVRNFVDTTAAGDSFNAGFLASRLAGKSPDRAAEDGAKIAARVIQSRGALVWPAA